MTAFCFVDVEVTDPLAYEEYRSRTLATITAWGGRFLVRGGEVEVKEGGYLPQRVLLVEFPDMGTARAWYESPEYQAILPLRLKASRSKVIFLEGLQQ